MAFSHPSRVIFATSMALALTNFALAKPPIDEDTLPEGAIARLGTKQRCFFLSSAHAFLDGGRVLAIVSAGPQVFYRDLATGNLLEVKVPPFDDATALALSPNGRTLVVQDSKSVIAWSLALEKKLIEIPVKCGNRCSCKISGDGNRLFLARNNSIESWDLQTGESKIIAA